MQNNIVIFDDVNEVAKAICEKIMDLSQDCDENKILNISLSGGTTPKIIFKMLAEKYSDKINWNVLHFWWGDERCVSHESSDSNYGEAKRILFDHIEIPEGNVHPVNTTLSPDQACIAYVQEMKKFIPIKEGIPRYDLILLGLGMDGHTASLFPNDISIDCPTWTAVAVQPETHQLRVSVSYKLINNANEVIFIVTGTSKEEVIKNIFLDKHKAIRYPAHYVQLGQGQLFWYMDTEAAKAVKPDQEA